MTVLIMLACCLSAWPIYRCIGKPVAQLLGLIPLN